MFKRFGILALLLFTVSCGSNGVLATYQVDGKVRKMTAGQTLVDLKDLYPQVSQQDMENFMGDPETVKLVAHSRLIEPELLKLEAIKVSNFVDSVEYQQNIEQQKNLLPYQLAFQKGRELIQKEITKQSIEMAEVSRIMFTNGDPLQAGETIDEVSMTSLLEELKASENLLEDFPIMAEKYSQEPLGAQTGGYLGNIQKGQFLPLDEVVFVKKSKDLYPEIITGIDGSYIILVHTPVKKMKVADLEKEGSLSSMAGIEMNYIKNNFKYLYMAHPETPNTYIFNKKEIMDVDIKENQKLLKIWNKSYTAKQLSPIFEVIVGRSAQEYTPDIILRILAQAQIQAQAQQQQASSLEQQLVVVLKGYNNSIKNSKEYKDLLKENLNSMELETVYQIMSEEVFKGISTNVTETEFRDFYKIPENKQVKSYSDNGEPVYATFDESKEAMTQAILTSRFTLVQGQFREEMANKYSITWNDLQVVKFIETLKKDYANYIKKNPMEETGMNFQ